MNKPGSAVTRLLGRLRVVHRQGLIEFELRSTSERLAQLRDMLGHALSNYEERARVHELAKGNGHSGRKIELE